jgi:ADP-ribosylation factor GTPase-activating protein 1
MSFPEPFPEEILDEIRDYPGNDKCCDCPSIDTDWASVSHGTLICLDCAGKHRSLGVHVSFVRSITMDTWSRQQVVNFCTMRHSGSLFTIVFFFVSYFEQVEMMRQGGNGQVRRFFKKLEIDNSPIHILYCTKGAEHYREKLKERVEKIMNGEIKSEKRLVKKKSFTEEKSIATSSSAETPTFDVSFGEGPLGLTLTKDYKERASVSRLVPAGAAQLAGVLVGDFIVGVAGKKLSNYDEIMHMIPCMGRPLTLKFGRIPTPKSSKASHSTSATHDHIHSSRSEPNLAQSSLYRSPESTQRKHPPSSLTIKVSSSAEPLQAEEPKKETLSKPIPRVAIRGSKKSGADPDSAEMEYVETAIKPKSTSKLVRRPLNKGSNDSLQKMEQSSAIESSVDSMCSEQRLTQSEKIVKSVWRDSKLLHDEANSTHDEEEDDNDIDNNDNEEEDESSGDSSDDDVGNDIEDEMEEEDEEEDEQSEEMDEKEDEHEEEEQEGEDLHKGDRHQFHQGGDVDEIVESAGRDDNPRYNTSENNNDYGVFVHEDDGNVPEEQISTRSAFEVRQRYIQYGSANFMMVSFSTLFFLFLAW